jgi:hypothetical protein
MKKIILLFILLGLSFASCDSEYLDPTKPSEEDVFTTRAGLIGASNGLQAKWSVGRQSPVYTIVTGSGFTTNEYRLLNAGNVDEAELLAGGVSVSSKNAVINNLWSQCLVINSEAQKVLDNIDIITVPAEKSSVFTQASIFKALAFGSLIQFFEKVPLQTMKNAPFNSRTEVLAAAIATLKTTEPYLATASGFTGLAGSIKYKNSVQALLARFYLMAGDNDNALLYANMVDLTSKSTFLYDAVSNNPIAFNAILSTTNYQPINRAFGLPLSLAPTLADGRINFYITSGSAPTTGAGFFDSNSKLIPLYLPGEMTLIKAEAYARKNDLTNAVTELNKVLTKTAASDPFGIGANLPAYSGALDQASILTEIYRNRCIELYMSGLNLEDNRRFGRPAAGTAGAERNRNWYPYPDSERFNNTNTPADPVN